MTQQEAIAVLQEFYDYNKTLTPHGESWLQADITINRYTQEELGKALPTAIAALREKAERERGCARSTFGTTTAKTRNCRNSFKKFQTVKSKIVITRKLSTCKSKRRAGSEQTRLEAKSIMVLCRCSHWICPLITKKVVDDMNRQEAWEYINGIASLAEVSADPTMTVCNVPTSVLMQVAFALKPPTPDPDTGLVPCGCGGKAKVWLSDLRQAVVTAYQVGCTECAMTTVWVRGKQENAIKVWNTAMSGGMCNHEN